MCISCTNGGQPIELNHAWRNEPKFKGKFLWIGRSRFERPQVAQPHHSPFPRRCEPGDVPTAVGMEDASWRADRCPEGDECEVQLGNDSARAVLPLHGGQRPSRSPRTGTHEVHSGSTEGEVPRGRSDDPRECDTGHASEALALQHGDHGGERGDLRAVQKLPLSRGAGGVPQMGNHGVDTVGSVQPRSGEVGEVGEVGRPTGEGHAFSWLWRKFLSGSRASCQDQTASCRATCTHSHVGQGEEQPSDPQDAGTSPGGIRGLFHGVFSGWTADHGGGDSRAARKVEDLADGQESRGGSQGRRAKGRRFREAVRTAIAAKRANRLARRNECGRSEELETDEPYVHDESYSDGGEYKVGGVPSHEDVYAQVVQSDYEASGDSHYLSEEGNVAVEGDNIDTPSGLPKVKPSGLPKVKPPGLPKVKPSGLPEVKPSGLPKVKLVYGDDYEAVKNLPRRRVRRTTKKRVRTWAGKALTALATLVTVCCAPLQSFAANVVDKLEEQVDFFEFFSGSAHMTETFAQRGHTVLEPRDIKFGHDLTKMQHQEDVLNDILYHRPKLVWIALPCTKWSPWQRLNYFGRKQ